MLKLFNALAFREILRKICQHSPIIEIQKTKKELVLSSMSTDELSFASVILKEPFFQVWNGQNETCIFVESKTLYNISKVIQGKSKVTINLSDERLQFEIDDLLLKKIVISGQLREPNALETFKIEEPRTRLRISSQAFLNIVRQLNNLVDETSLFFRKDSREIVFSGKQREMTLEIIFQDCGAANNMEKDIFVEFPLRFLQHFSPLMCHFEELLLGFDERVPLIIKGYNEKWKLVLMVSKIDKNISSRSEI